MFGIAVLFFLGIWIIITIVTMVIGSKFGRKPATKLLGAFLGFMLTMGGFIVYWKVEYIYIQHTVTKLCKADNGTITYISPEQWRKQIGEEEWEKQILVNKTIHSSDRDKMIVTFEGRKYYPIAYINPRIIGLTNQQHAGHEINKLDEMYYDIISKQVLFRQISYDVQTPPLAVSGKDVRFWLNSIDDCNWGRFPPSIRFLAKRKYTNSKSLSK